MAVRLTGQRMSEALRSNLADADHSHIAAGSLETARLVAPGVPAGTTVTWAGGGHVYTLAVVREGQLRILAYTDEDLS